MTPTRTTSRRRRYAVLAAALLLSATTFSACSDDDGPSDGGSPTTEGSAETDEPIGTSEGAGQTDAALEPFYSQEIGWQKCQTDAKVKLPANLQCGKLTVPLDYDDPTGREISLFLTRIKASGTATGSLVVNPGGPGQSGAEFAIGAGELFGPAVLERLDVVGFDPRGVGESDAIDCVSDRDLDAFRALDQSPDTPEEVSALVAATESFNAGCVEKSGPLAQHVSTEEVARDVDVLRSALGDEQLTYYGASYGTSIGAAYAELFPDHAGRLVLDGAVDQTLDPVDRSIAQIGGFETALTAYVQDCVEGGSCPLGATEEEAKAAVKALLTALDAKPLKGTPGRPVTQTFAQAGIIQPLYSKESWPLLTQALVAAGQGDGKALLKIADGQAGRLDSGKYTSNNQEAIIAINCLDDSRGLTPDEVADRAADYEEASPTFGSFNTYAPTACLGLQVESPEKLDIDGAGAPPILVVGTTRDPATPYAWAESLAEQLESGVLLTREGDGHVAYTSGNPCITAFVDDFLVEGTVPDDETVCPEA